MRKHSLLSKSRVDPCRAVLLALVLLFVASRPCNAQMEEDRRPKDVQDANPAPAIQGILRAFQSFEVVAMPTGHGEKDMDDFILSLIRAPHFPTAVNDIVVECGNIRYQAILDRYIAGEKVAFTEVQHVWRDTTVQQMCGASEFYEQLFPLVRKLINAFPPQAA